MGPGEYSPEIGDHLTKPKEPITIFSKNVSRPRNFGNAGAEDNGGPGAYDSPVRFGDDVKGFKIGEKRDGKIEDGVGPGTYDPELADNLTKTHNPAFDIGGNSPSRSDMNFSRKNDQANIGPGVYGDSNVNFGNDVNGFTIGEKRPDLQRGNAAGPGEYEQSDDITKPRVPTVIIGKEERSPDRRQGDATGSGIGPGAYNDDSKGFGQETKNFKIPSKPRESARKNHNPGPGAYQEDLPQKKSFNMGGPTGPRADRFDDSQNKSADAGPGPGDYPSQEESFGKDTKTYKFVKPTPQEMVVDNIGPGTYDIDTSQPSIQGGKFDSQPRPDNFVNDNDKDGPAPGDYESPERQALDRNDKSFTIPPAKDTDASNADGNNSGLGPGCYNPDESVNRPKTPVAVFSKNERSRD